LRQKPRQNNIFAIPIRNQFTVFEDWVEVELPGSKILICNVDDLYFVELHNWCCSSYGYA